MHEATRSVIPVLTVFLFAAISCSSQEIIDGNPPTQESGMHVCPAGMAMRGAQVSNNQFLCSRTDEKPDCFVDYSSQRQGMHACPAGSYMRGYQDNRNELLCCFDRRAGTSHLGLDVLDTGSQDHGMHVCSGHLADTVMVGIQNQKNQFLCAQKLPPFAPSSLPAPPGGVPRMRGFLGVPRTTAQDRAAWQFVTWNWLAHILQLNAVKSYSPPAMPAVAGAASFAPPPPNFTIVKQETIEGTEQLTIQYASPIDGVPEQAFLIFPPNRSAGTRFPAVVVTHGHDDNCKDSLARNWNDPDHAAALYFAKLGAIAIAPDTRSFCAYRTLLQEQLPNLDHDGLISGVQLGTMPGQYILDNMVRISLLEARPDVDPNRIFTAGLSLGSYQAMWTAAMDDRVAKVVVGDLFLNLQCLNSSGLNHSCQTIPSISTDYEGDPNNHDKTISQESLLIDTADIAALIAPRPILVVWGSADHFFTGPPACVDRARGESATVYREFGVSDNFHFAIITGMQHEFEDFTSAQFLLGVEGPRRDYGTQINSMHSCPAGFGMIGIHESDNEFLCARAQTNSCSVDPPPGANPTQRNGMHACPSGSFMQGADVSGNQFTCCRAPGTTTGETVDSGTQLEGMHGCPQGLARHFMTGLESSKNQLLCEE